MNKNRFFSLVPSYINFNFVGKKNRRIFMAISLVAFLTSFYLLFSKGLNFGIDFLGGAEVQVKINEAWDIGKLRSVIDGGGIKDARIQSLGEASLNEFVIRVRAEEGQIQEISENVKSLLSKELKEGEGFIILKADVVGAAAGSVLRQQGFQALFFTLVVILIYLGLRFDSYFAVASVVALLHDAIVVLGIFVLTQKQFDLAILAAILSLMGYSINDTIIVFDRLRETMQLYPNQSVEQNANKAINETLGRSLVTSLTTFIVAVCIMIFGGMVIHDFAFAFMCGVLIGTFSSVFVASALLVEMIEYREKKKAQNQGKPIKAKKVYQVRPDPSGLN